MVCNGRVPLIIEDTYKHSLARELAATYDLNIRSYIGVPVFYKNGDMYGSLCIVSSKPSAYTEKEVEILQRYSNLYSYVIELEKKANIDYMTNLYNRHYLFDHFNEFGPKGTLMLFDLDGFKDVNDLFGHDIGDLVLIEVAKKMRSFLCSHEVGIRLGGDEFVLLLPTTYEQHQLEDRAQKLIQLLADWSNFPYDVHTSISLGIVTYQEHNSDIRTLLKKADQAMYQAKLKGKNTYQIATT